MTESTASAPHNHVAMRHFTRRGVLWVGLRCDVRCKFCYDERMSSSAKVWIDVEDAVRSLDKFRRYYRNTAVDFMGGEPTLHPRMLDIVAHARSIGLLPTVITHGMHLADIERAAAYWDAGIHDFLVSIHGVGDTVRAIHGRGSGNADRQLQALDNLRRLAIPFRFNVTMIRDNIAQLPAIAELAAVTGARVVNFLTFNPYFEWAADSEIEFQARHSEVAPLLGVAIDICTAAGVEANVRYMPPCQLRGREAHVYTGYQLPYDAHEWDYNSWYDAGHEGVPEADWYLAAAVRQQQRHQYVQGPVCDRCALRNVCDGFHAQYADRWGTGEAKPYDGPVIKDPAHFVQHQSKVECDPADDCDPAIEALQAARLTLPQFREEAGHRAGVRQGPR